MNKKLTKSRSNIVISGSLAGVAEYIGIDPTIVRVIYVILSLVTTGFPGFLLYIALMVLLPSGNTRQETYYNTYSVHMNILIKEVLGEKEANQLKQEKKLKN